MKDELKDELESKYKELTESESMHGKLARFVLVWEESEYRRLTEDYPPESEIFMDELIKVMLAGNMILEWLLGNFLKVSDFGYMAYARALIDNRNCLIDRQSRAKRKEEKSLLDCTIGLLNEILEHIGEIDADEFRERFEEIKDGIHLKKIEDEDIGEA